MISSVLPQSLVPPLTPQLPRLRVAMIQSGYLPWKGYFDIIHDVDLFIFLDDLQYTVRDWRNRNRIKAPQGLHWLSIPIGNRRDLAIDEVKISDPAWQRKHWATLCHRYARTPHFQRYRTFFEEIYLDRAWTSLSDLNQHLIVNIATEFLGIQTTFQNARPMNAQGHKTVRLLDLLKQVGADLYVTGPTTRVYLNVPMLEQAGIQVVFKDFSGYPEYPQIHPPFSHQVSIVDLLFQTGPEAEWYIWGWRQGPKEGI